MDDQLDPPPPRPRSKEPVKVAPRDNIFPLATFDKVDATYFAERIAELHCHAVRHDGELCAKLNRARIGGIIEVLSRLDIEVVCDWDRIDKEVIVLRADQFAEFKKVKESK